MEKIITAKAYVLGDDIDTDQIIPAEYLMYDPTLPEERKMFGRFALSGVPADQAGLPKGHIHFVDQTKEENTLSQFSVIIAGRNFGCGSSREHAPLALAEAGVKVVIAESYARIFYRNAVNGGYVIPLETPQRLCDKITTSQEVRIDLSAPSLTIGGTSEEPLKLCPLGDISEIIAAGGIFPYAEKMGMGK